MHGSVDPCHRMCVRGRLSVCREVCDVCETACSMQVECVQRSV